MNLETVDDSGSSFQFAPFEPWRVRAGLAYDFGRTLLTLDADLQVAQGPTKATVNGRVGAAFALTDDLSFGVGAFTDLDPYSTTPATFGDSELNFYGVTSGIELTKFRKFAPSEGTDGISFRTAIAFRYAYGTGDFAGARVVDDVSTIDPANPDLIGINVTKIGIHELSIYVGSGIQF
ncbi:MAG: hypothetical protein WBG86_07540 [Polyangiales bacterium]